MDVKTLMSTPSLIKFRERSFDEGESTIGIMEVPSEVQLLRCGRFSYFSPDDMEINQGHLLSMVNNFKSNVRGVDLAIDYGHNAFAEAAGWMEDVYLSEDGNELWCKVKWTPEATEKLEGREYRYISSEFSFDYCDNEGGVQYGPTLFGAGLTNRPFVKNMNPLIPMNEENKMNIEELKKKLAEQELMLAEKDLQLKETNDKFARERELQEKHNCFNKMLAEGKVVEAQREAFIAGDMVKFSELAIPIKLHNIGSEQVVEKKDNDLSAEQAEDKIIELANIKFAEANGKLKFQECIHNVLVDNKKLAEKYRTKFSF